MVWSTFLSLNVHEPLQFDGTEIVVHPDIFQLSGTTDNQSTAGSTLRQSFQSTVSSSHQANPPSKGNHGSTGGNAPVLQTSSSGDERSTIAQSDSMRQSQQLQSEDNLLKVGDMIEIRVWDSLNKEKRGTEPFIHSANQTPHNSAANTPITAFRKRAQPTSPHSSPNFGAPLLNVTYPEATKVESSHDIPSDPLDTPRTTPVQSVGKGISSTPELKKDDNNRTVLQQSVESSPLSPGISPTITTESSPQNEETRRASGTLNGNNNNNNNALPPMFPRQNSSRVSAVSTGERTPIMTQRNTSEVTSTTHERPRAPLLRPRHDRDRNLSDITTDTHLGNPFRGLVDTSNSKQPILGTQSEDTDDTSWVDSGSNTANLRLSFVMLLTEKSLTSLKASSRTHISILRQVADLYLLSSYDMVTLHKLEGNEIQKALRAVSADFVTVTIKEQYLSRGELHSFQNSLIGSWIYEGQRLYEPSRGIHAYAREIRHDGAYANSGIVTESTKIAYRSRSARIFWLVQISSEMWDFADPYQAGQSEGQCEIYFDKFISFMYNLFEKWKQAEVTHRLTVVFFSRTFISQSPHNAAHQGHAPRDIYGRQYEDHCRVVIENETRADWNSLISKIREAFLSYPKEVGWNLDSGHGARRPSTAAQGNLLEAVNITMNLLQYHYLDRDLHRTGNSIVIVSAGNGVFEVDKKLSTITYQRMMDNGIGSDMLSLSLPPLHIAPFFLFFNEVQEVESEIPHWIHLSFVSYGSENLVNLNPHSNLSGVSMNTAKEALLDIGPNGFLRSRKKTNPKKLITRNSKEDLKTFTEHGNAAASPAVKTVKRTQKKELAERDFRDVLEACRPRGAGLMPKALKALLKMYVSVQERNGNIAVEKAENENPEKLGEWNEVNMDGIAKTILVNSLDKKDASSPLITAMSPPRINEVDRQDGSSMQSSSYTSHYSGLLGTSYERRFVIPGSSSKNGGSRMQRSPSIDLCDELTKSRNNSSHRSDAVSSRSSGDSTEKDIFFVEALREYMQVHDRKKMMEPAKSPILIARDTQDRSNHDALKITPSRSTTFTVPGRTSSLASLSSHGQNLPVNQAPVGGLEAALTNYGSVPEKTWEASEGDVPGELPLTTSSGRIVPPLLRISEMAPQGLSPLILPPPRKQADLFPRDNPFAITQGSFDRHFVRPQREEARTRSVGSALSSSPEASKNRPRSGSTGYVASQKTRPRSGSAGQQREATRKPSSPSSEARVARARPRSGSGGQSSSRTTASPSPARKMRSVKNAADAPPSTGRQGTGTRRRKAINPFRQQDEDEVLAQKSHNSRRWSHVFPQGEIEFKRRTGPNWKSLSAPAILPLSIDYFPSSLELEHNYTFSIYNVTLSEFEKNNFSSNKELLLEMVRQRIVQDYQFVPSYVVDDRDVIRRGVARNDPTTQDTEGSVRMYLSIGHRLQVLLYEPSSDTVWVKTFLAKNSQGENVGTFKYFYYSYCRERGGYEKVVQEFTQYSSPYNWNKVDRIICGDDDREMREGMRFKRLMFVILPDKHKNEADEEAYVAKFMELLKYFEKLREKDSVPLNVKIERAKDELQNTQHRTSRNTSTPGIAGKSMVRFYIQLRTRGREQFEYIEVSIDSTFNTQWSYRIIFNWFVASSGKVDTQVQLLQRRCTQFRLNLINSSETSVSKSLFLNPFRAPIIFIVKEKSQVSILEKTLSEMDYIHDGVFHTTREFCDCLDPTDNYDFGKKWGRPLAGRQVIHRSGVLYVRIIEDRSGKAVVFAFLNTRHTEQDSKTKLKAQRVFEEFSKYITELSGSKGNLSPAK